MPPGCKILAGYLNLNTVPSRRLERAVAVLVTFLLHPTGTDSDQLYLQVTSTVRFLLDGLIPHVASKPQ